MLSCTTKIADRWRRAYSFVRYQEIDVSAVEHQSFQIVHAALIKLQGPKAFPDFAKRLPTSSGSPATAPGPDRNLSKR